MHRSLLLAVAALAAAACTAPDDDLGQVDLSLIGQTPSGATYRLRDAVLTIDGPGATRVFRTEDDLARTRVSTRLPSGGYQLGLADGWRLERLDTARVVPVEATLLSANPLPFDVGGGGATPLTIRFRAGAEDLELSEGDVDIDIGVEDPVDAGVPDAEPVDAGVPDAEPVPPLSAVFAPASLDLIEGASGSLQVHLSHAPAAPVTVRVSDTGVWSDPAELTFTPDDYAVPQTITVSADEDENTVDTTGQIHLSIDSVPLGTALVLIRDNDMPSLVLSATSLQFFEGTTSTVVVRLSSRPNAPLTIDATSFDPLVTAAPAQMTFDAGNWNTGFPLLISAAHDDDLFQMWTTVRLSAPGIAPHDIAVAVLDDDVQTILTSAVAITMDEGTSRTVTARLAYRPASTVTVAVSGTANRLTVTPTMLTFTPEAYATPQSVTITAVTDIDRTPGAATLGFDGPNGFVTVPVTIAEPAALGYPTYFGQSSVEEPSLLRVFSFQVGTAFTLERLQIMGGGGGAVRLALFRDGQSNRPGQLLMETAAIPLPAESQVVNVDVPTLRIGTGRFWLGVVQSAPASIGQASSSQTQTTRCVVPMSFDAPFPQNPAALTCATAPALNLAAIGHF